MKPYMSPDFLLQNETARILYHTYASPMPIIDYHCHLDPRLIANDYHYTDLTEAWLGGDHYKWRAMRANGVPEAFITGDKPPREKFHKWAETMPYTMRNPLYHWTHLELSRIFGISQLFNPESADSIYEEASALLQRPDFSARGLMMRMNVELVCTTDDPVDTLEYHRVIRRGDFPVRVLPAWRPDKVMAVEVPAAFNAYLVQLEAASGLTILSFSQLVEALQIRHDYFAAEGCTLSDHGLGTFYADAYTDTAIQAIFMKARAGKPVTADEARQYRSALLYELAAMDARSGWVQQFHLGANRNNNARMYRLLGADAGFDAIDDQSVSRPMNRFFSRLDDEGLLAKTIVYNLNPRDNELMVANVYNFNDSSVPGKMQYGAAWWFFDQMDGIERQLNTLSSMGLLSRFVGMLTDSRSLLSYPRHEYFRRILCNLLGSEIERGLLPSSELPFIGKMVSDISYNNAKRYFGW
ncbi:MAG: glucuronate isomerase [Tannerellaceae bacterium]